MFEKYYNHTNRFRRDLHPKIETLFNNYINKNETPQKFL